MRTTRFVHRLLEEKRPQQAAALLQARLAESLPGRKAQFNMAPVWRKQEWERNPSIPTDAKVACVLQLLYLHQGSWRVVLMERSINPHDRHSGQVSFPGGRYEEADGTLENAALREMEEEIGLLPRQIHLSGRLTELYIPVSHFLVYPFVGVITDEKVDFALQQGEAENVLLPELDWMANPLAVKTTDVVAGNGMPLKDVPYFDIEGRVVWGATAMIVGEFLEL
jgi:8-oxo-dGTP pyrophosphatase MutT (NUDIX family)